MPLDLLAVATDGFISGLGTGKVLSAFPAVVIEEPDEVIVEPPEEDVLIDDDVVTEGDGVTIVSPSETVVT